LYQDLKSFPQKDRYILGQKIEVLTLEVLQTTILAGISTKEKKLPLLEKSIAEVDLVKIMLRLANDINILDSKKYLVLENCLQEIGKMLGGWRRSLK